MSNFEKVRISSSSTKRFIRKTLITAAVVLVLMFSAAIFFAPRISTQQLAIQHEFEMQSLELSHRISNCNNAVDSMVPGTAYINAAAAHCALMWMQMKRLEAITIQARIPPITIHPLIEETIRAAARYAEYQTAMNRPQYHSSESDE